MWGGASARRQNLFPNNPLGLDDGDPYGEPKLHRPDGCNSAGSGTTAWESQNAEAETVSVLNPRLPVSDRCAIEQFAHEEAFAPMPVRVSPALQLRRRLLRPVLAPRRRMSPREVAIVS